MGSSEPNLENQAHPLLTPVILDVLFEHLPKSSWKVARLVHTVWNSTLLLRWREEMFVTIDNRHEITGNLTTDLAEFTPTSSKMDPYRFLEKPFRNVRITYSSDILYPNELQFWLTCGQWLKRLHFHHFAFVDMEQIRLVGRLLFVCTPNLEELKWTLTKWICNQVYDNLDPGGLMCIQDKLKSVAIKSRSCQSYGVTTNGPSLCPISWVDFLSVFQHIEKLDLSACHPRTEDLLSTYGDLINAIGTVKDANANRNSVLNITELQLPHQNPHVNVQDNPILSISDIIKDLCLLSMPLCILNIDVSAASQSDIAALIETHQTTLRELTLVRYFVAALESFPYKVLPLGLTKLVCSGNVFPNICFLANTPNLRELELVNQSWFGAGAFETLERIAPLQHLNQVTFSGGSGKFDDAVMNVVARVMPNVAKLTVKGDWGTFESVCKCWPKLEHLTADLIGVTEKQFVETIVQLQNLQSLTTGCPPSSTLLLGNISIYEGLMKLPRLKKVVTVFMEGVSLDAVTALKQKVTHVTYIFLRGGCLLFSLN